jgi:bacterioferritin-associated ferredoxin
MIVCLCHRVRDRDIEQAVHEGTASFELLQDDTRVASSCGSCYDCAREIFDAAYQHRAACGQAAVTPTFALVSVPVPLA